MIMEGRCLWKMIGDTIKKLRETKKMTQIDLANILGISNTAISQYESGRRSVDDDIKIKLAGLFNVSVDYLLGIRPEGLTIGGLSNQSLIEIPAYLDAQIPAPNIAEDVTIGVERIYINMEDKAEYFALKISGDAMTPRICPGDIVVVRRQNVLKTGDVGVFYIGENDSAMRIYIHEEDGITLKATNPEHETRHYTFAEAERLPIKIVGKVVEIRGRL